MKITASAIDLKAELEIFTSDEGVEFFISVDGLKQEEYVDEWWVTSATLDYDIGPDTFTHYEEFGSVQINGYAYLEHGTTYHNGFYLYDEYADSEISYSFDLTAFLKSADFKGTWATDFIFGSNESDALFGQGGIDYIEGGGANDVVDGGAGHDQLYGNAGNDQLFGQGGNDTLYGGAGADALDGGLGDDTASYEHALKAVGASLWNRASNTGEAKGDIYVSVENLIGSSFNDRLEGNTGSNVLDGGDGSDRIYGGSGSDKLYGGGGYNSGADTFIYKKVSESTMSSRDIIYDFSQETGDKINLAAIDANTKLGGNQDFKFVGENAFSKTAGELRYLNKGDDSYLYGDVNGDGKTDFSVCVDWVTDLTVSDFIL